MTAHPETAANRVAREDLVTFVAACLACTRQQEFYASGDEQGLGIDFLHAYVLGNYRRLYARALALGINAYNRGLIVHHLLAAGAPPDPADKAEEGALIRATLRHMPPNQALRILRRLALQRINNRRTRAVIREYLDHRSDPTFEALKYRAMLRPVVRHAHAPMTADLGTFLFRPRDVLRGKKRFQSPLLDAWARAHFSQAALYELPFTVAEGFAARHGVPRDRFLEGIAPKMTRHERLRLHQSAGDHDVDLEIDAARLSPTRIALWALSLHPRDREARADTLDEALTAAARRTVDRLGFRLGRVAAVLDASWSSSGSGEKRRRPLAVALAASRILAAAAREYRAFWAPIAPDREILVRARGQTALADAVIDAIAWRPDLIVVVSDGYENDPPGATAALVAAHTDSLGPVPIVHANPVFDAAHFAPRPLGPPIPTVGLRDAEDLPLVLPFVRFATGDARYRELESWLGDRVADFLAEAP